MEFQELVNSLTSFSQKRLGFHKPPKITFADDEDNAQKTLGKTAYYNPSIKEIVVFKTNRHEKDQLRSLAHELVHYNQDCNGKFSDLGNVGEGYAQENEHLREMEREAYEQGNLNMRDWEDTMKKKQIMESKELVKKILEEAVGEWNAEDGEYETEDEEGVVPLGDAWNVQIVHKGRVENEFEMKNIDYESAYREVKILAAGWDFEIQPLTDDGINNLEEIVENKQKILKEHLTKWAIK